MHSQFSTSLFPRCGKNKIKFHQIETHLLVGVVERNVERRIVDLIRSTHPNRNEKMFKHILSFAVCVACVFRAIAVKFEIGPCSVYFSENCLPDSIEMYLFASERPTEPIHLNRNNLTLPEWMHLNRTNKLLVHGYGGNLEFFATKTIRDGK